MVFVTAHFWCWQKSHYSSPTVTKGFGGAVSPLFDPAFTRRFPHFKYKEVPDLQNRKSTPSHLFYSILFTENAVIHCLFVPNTLEIESRTRFTFSQSQYSKRLLNGIAHKQSMKYNPFDL